MSKKDQIKLLLTQLLLFAFIAVVAITPLYIFYSTSVLATTLVTFFGSYFIAVAWVVIVDNYNKL